MIKKRFISMLVLLAAVVTGAWADQLASSYSSNATLNAVTVSASMEVTIATGVTVTINNGLNITSGTLTVKGPGTLVVNGKAGSNGGGGSKGGNGTPGGVAISGNIVVQDGATVQANGGAGGNGGAGNPEIGGHGANGAAAISGNVTVQGGATVKASGGNGGNGGYSDADTGGNGGNGGNGVSGNVTVNGGSATINGGNGGSGGQSGPEDNGSSGSSALAYSGTLTLGANVTLYEGTNASGTVLDGNTGSSRVYAGAKKQNMYAETKVVVTSITFDPATASMTLGGETLTLTPTVLPADATDKTVTWTTSDASVATVTDGVVTAVGAGTATITATATNGTADTSDDFSATCEVTVSPAGYSVALKEGTEDASNWQGKAGEGEYQSLPLEGVAAGTAVSVKYNGTKKVKSVKAVKKAPATITVTWNNDDITGSGNSFTKDGVTITVDVIDFDEKVFLGGGTFTTTLGNFTKIEVTTANWSESSPGWSGSSSEKTWTGNASSVSFSKDIDGMGEGNTKFVFTIEPTN